MAERRLSDAAYDYVEGLEDKVATLQRELEDKTRDADRVKAALDAALDSITRIRVKEGRADKLAAGVSAALTNLPAEGTMQSLPASTTAAVRRNLNEALRDYHARGPLD